MYCNKEIETMDRAGIRNLQLMKLQKMLRWTYEKSEFYRNQMQMAGLRPEDVRSLEDLSRLPMTTREQLAAHSPFGLLTGPVSGVMRLHLVGEGERLVARAYNSGDLGRATEMTARALVAGGVSVASIIEICGECMDSNALGIQYAAEVLGATVVPAVGMKLERQVHMMDKFRVTDVFGNPQQILQLMVAAQALDYDLRNMSVTRVFSVNTSLRNTVSEHIASRFGVNVFNLYSLPELSTPGLACECEAKCGMHIQEDYFYPEIVSLAGGDPVEDGRMGELVLTSLASEAMPVLRFRTGQLASVDREPCACGRTLLRMRVP